MEHNNLVTRSQSGCDTRGKDEGEVPSKLVRHSIFQVDLLLTTHSPLACFCSSFLHSLRSMIHDVGDTKATTLESGLWQNITLPLPPHFRPYSISFSIQRLSFLLSSPISFFHFSIIPFIYSIISLISFIISSYGV